MNINPFAVQTPDSVEHTIGNANATFVRFNHGKGLFAGHYIAAGRLDGSIVILNVETKGVLRLLQGHIRAVTSISWSPYNRYLASSSYDWNVIVWDLSRSNAERAHTIRFDAPVLSVQFSTTSSTQLIVVLQSQQAFIVDLSRQAPQARESDLSIPTGSTNGHLTNGVDPSPSASASQASTSIYEKRAELGVSSGDTGSILAAGFAADGATVALGTSKGDIVIYDTQTKHLLQRVSSGQSGVREVSFDRLGKTLVANSNDRSVRLYSYVRRQSDEEDEQDGANVKLANVTVTLLHRFQDLINRTPWSGIGFSGDGEYVFGGATHKAAHNIYIWDRGAGVLDKILQGPRDSLVHCDWHPNRPMLASVSHTGAVHIWFNPPTEIWSAYAPGFEELEENVMYEEREDEFDLEDEEEVTRRKQDEEEAHVDILSSGPDTARRRRQQRRRRHKGAAGDAYSIKAEGMAEDVAQSNGVQGSKHYEDQKDVAPYAALHFPHRKGELEGSEDDGDEDEDDDDDDETFAIPVRLSLDLPDLDYED